jgi:hypothetical protein
MKNWDKDDDPDLKNPEGIKYEQPRMKCGVTDQANQFQPQRG